MEGLLPAGLSPLVEYHGVDATNYNSMRSTLDHVEGEVCIVTDGLLAGSITETFKFAGYHRLNLAKNLLLPKDTRIGIVILESVPVGNGVKYALVNTRSYNKKGIKAYNRAHEDDEYELQFYAKGIVNPGESFVSAESGKWTDWSEAIDVIGKMGYNACMTFDNLPIKAHTYPRDQVKGTRKENVAKRVEAYLANH